MASRLATPTATVTDRLGEQRYTEVPLTDGTSHLASITNAVATDFADLGYYRYRSIQVVNGADEETAFTVVGSNDGTNFVTIAYGAGSGTPYVQSTFTASAATAYVLYLPPDDVVRYVRLLISDTNAANGCTATISGWSG